MSVDQISQAERVRLKLVLETLRAMLTARHYLTEEIAWPSDSLVQHVGDYARLNMLLFHEKENVSSVYVAFANETGVKTINVLRDSMNANKVQHAILIIRDKLTPFASTALIDLIRARTESERRATKRKNIEVFHEEDLLFDITKSELVPPHILLTAAQKQRVLTRYRATETQIPQILTSDPIARFYGLRRGQMCRIERPSETAGTAITYRIAV